MFQLDIPPASALSCGLACSIAEQEREWYNVLLHCSGLYSMSNTRESSLQDRIINTSYSTVEPAGIVKLTLVVERSFALLNKQ